MNSLKLTCVAMALIISACTQLPAEVVYRGDNFYGRGGSNDVVIGSADAPVYNQDSPKYKTEEYSEPASVSSVGVKELAPIKVNSLEPPRTAQSQPLNLASAEPQRNILQAPMVEQKPLAPLAENKTVVPAIPQTINLKPLPQIAQQEKPALALAVTGSRAESHSIVEAPKEELENKISLNLFPKPTEPTADKEAKPSQHAQFIWPVQGKVITKFGARAHGQLNDGINIAADEGEPIWSAADGTVVYAGSQIKGYGNMVILRHENGWITTYAHASKLAVSKDDKVKQGQIIAYVGATGGVQTSQLHFGIREGVTPVNPERFLSRDVAALQ